MRENIFFSGYAQPSEIGWQENKRERLNVRIGVSKPKANTTGWRVFKRVSNKSKEDKSITDSYDS